MIDIWTKIESEPGTLAYSHGTSRAVHPKDTLSWVTPLQSAVGITRVADITHLDWVGIPVYQAIRPMSRSLSVSQGKGITQAQAKVSAVMEAVEHFHAEELSAPTTLSTVAEMRKQVSYAPETLPTKPGYILPEETLFHWVQGQNILTREPDWVPRDLCCLDLSVRDGIFLSPFQTSSNGLASGNSFGEAVLHSLLEIIERDSTALARSDEAKSFDKIAVSKIKSKRVRNLVEHLSSKHIECAMYDVTGPTNIPCFEVELRDQYLSSPVWGAGCHTSATTAMIRAITEACQSRLAYIAGTRDDMVYPDPDVFNPEEGASSSLLFPTLTVPPRPTQHTVHDHLPVGKKIEELARLIADLTGASPIAIDLSIDTLKIPVVFVVAPGLRFDGSHTRLKSK